MAPADMRKDYGLAGLFEKDLAKNPFRQFEEWFQQAEAAQITGFWQGRRCLHDRRRYRRETGGDRMIERRAP